MIVLTILCFFLSNFFCPRKIENFKCDHIKFNWTWNGIQFSMCFASTFYKWYSTQRYILNLTFMMNSIPRDWQLSTSWVPNWGPSWKLQYITALLYWVGLRRPLDCPPLCRETQVSRTAEASSSKEGPCQF